MEKKNKIYLLIFLFILFFGLLSTGAFNVIIDPAGIFNIIEREGFNAVKSELMRGGGRRDKALALKWGDYDTLILGTSRAEIGIDPKSPLFENRSVYNSALPSSHINELYSVFTFIKEKTGVKRLIIGLDLMLFTSSLDIKGDFNESLFAVDSSFKIINSILSFDEFQRSLDTLRDNLNNKTARYSKLGRRYHLSQVEKLKGHRNFFNIEISKNLRAFAKSKRTIKYHREKIKLLGSIIKESKEAGIDLILFISPVHATQFEELRLISHMDVYEQWQRDLTEVILENPELKLWDFSGANRITSEAIPPAGDATTKMRWYWDGSHYSSDVGEIILKRVFGKETAGFKYGDFGVTIDKNNIEKHLAEKRRAQQKYRLKFPEEITMLDDMWKKAVEDTK